MTPTGHPAPAMTHPPAVAPASAEMPVSRIAAFADPDGDLIGLPGR